MCAWPCALLCLLLACSSLLLFPPCPPFPRLVVLSPFRLVVAVVVLLFCCSVSSCLFCSVVDVVLDLRPNSETYGNYFEIELNDKTPKALYIPQGCAHGYRVLENNTITMYKATKIHSAKHDLGIKWDSFGYDWNIKDPILSDKDLNLIEFKDYK